MELVEIIFLKNLYYTITLLLVLMFAVSISAHFKKYKDLSHIKNFLLISFSLGIALYFGLRDYAVGVDTYTYKYNFEHIFSSLDSFQAGKDFLWDFFNYTVAQFTNNVDVVFIITAIGYIVLPLFGVYKYLKYNTIFFFMLFVISPNFFLYGANGIRSGLAASIVLFSFRYYKSYKQYIVLVIASLIHLSMIVPSVFFIASKYIKTIKYPLLIWIVLLLFSLLGVNFLAVLPFSIDRLDSYINNSIGDKNLLNTMMSFIIYSISPILVGIYVLYIKKKYDVFYTRLLITYILASCIYITAFNSIYSVRFAYLSEFLMPFLLVYPLLKFKLWKYVEVKLVLIFSIIFFIKAYKIIII